MTGYMSEKLCILMSEENLEQILPFSGTLGSLTVLLNQIYKILFLLKYFFGNTEMGRFIKVVE